MKRVLAIVLCLAMCLGLLAVTASAADGTKVYLKPNDNWKKDGARFAVYCFGNGEKWIDMTASSTDGIYEVTIPAGYPNIIFCRMNPGTTANNWSNKWNQTADLTVPTDDKICCNITGWDNSSQWTTLGGEVAPIVTHYVVAGQPDSAFGGYWNTTANETNKMTLKAGTTNIYELVLKNLPVGSDYQFKVVKISSTGEEWFGNGQANIGFEVHTVGDVTITFNADTHEINVSGDCLKELTDTKITIHVKHPESWTDVYFWGWGAGGNESSADWPGDKKLTADPDNEGWSVVTGVAGWITGGLICHGTDPNAMQQTGDITLEEGKDAWIVVKADHSFTVSYEKPADTDEDEEPAPTPENFTVNVQVPEDWTTVNVYACDANWNYLTGPWPGNAATKGDDGWYTLTVAGDVKYVIVNNGTDQTIDIPVTAEKEVWIQVGEKIADGLEGAGKFDGKVVEKPAEPAETGDAFDMIAVSALMIGAMIGLSGTILNKKKFF